MSLEIRSAAFSYGNGKMVFEHINLRSVENDILCILGPNGCGKTTLLKCLSGILDLKQGEVLLDGKSLRLHKRREIASAIGYIPQESASGFAYSVLEVVVMGRTPHLSIFASPSATDYDIATGALEMVGASHLTEKLYTELSGGERQLVLTARTLAQQPKLLLLDEPTSHLDFRNQTLMLRLARKLARSGLSVIMTSHFPNHAIAFSGKVALMNNGNFIAQGTPDEVMTEENLSRTYGIDVRIHCVQDRLTREEIRFCVAV